MSTLVVRRASSPVVVARRRSAVVTRGASSVVLVRRPSSVIVVRPVETPPPPPPEPGTARSYRHVQVNPSTLWTVIHNLGFQPAGLLTFDSAGEPIQGQVVRPSTNLNVTLISFISPVAGEALVS